MNTHGRMYALSAVTMFCITVTMPAYSADPEPEKSSEKLLAVERSLYENRNELMGNGKMMFLQGILLPAHDPACRPESQYLTSALISARNATQIGAQKNLRETFKAATQDIAPKLGRKIRLAAYNRILTRVIGERSPLAEAIPESAEPPKPQHILFPAHELNECSSSETTQGVHMLKWTDQKLRAAHDIEALATQLLQTEAIHWGIIEKSEANAEECKSIVNALSPFMLYRNDKSFIVCGYAQPDETLYWMAYDLSCLELKVTLGYTSGHVTFSRYKKLLVENQSRPNPVKITPLFWDFTSYFSIKNMGAFRLLPARDTEIVTALYLESLDDADLHRILEEELKVAIEEQNTANAEMIARKKRMLDRNRKKQSD